MPGIHIFGKQSNMLVLNVEHDKEYDLTQIAERFEVPYAELKNKYQEMAYYAMVEVKAKEVARHAVSTYERLYHWRFYSSRKPVIDTSEIQYDLDDFRSFNSKDSIAVDAGSNIDKLGTVAYVVKLWFITPKVRVEVITPESSDPDVVDGLVNLHNITEFTPLEVK